jgi:hypothetical protein
LSAFFGFRDHPGECPKVFFKNFRAAVEPGLHLLPAAKVKPLARKRLVVFFSEKYDIQNLKTK